MPDDFQFKPMPTREQLMERYESPHDKRAREFKEAQKQWLIKYKYAYNMLNTPDGKKFMEDFEKDVIHDNVYQPDSFDRTAFNLGRMDVFLKLRMIQKGLDLDGG